MTIAGTPLPHESSRGHVTGDALYTDDLVGRFPNLLHAWPVLAPHAHALVTLLDPNLEWVFDVSRSKSKSRNTPFNGRAMHGAAVATIVGGRLVYLHPGYYHINEPKQKTASVGP